MKRCLLYGFSFLFFLASCGDGDQHAPVSTLAPVPSSDYSYDRSFLSRYIAVVELQRGSSKILLAPQYEGRVMTSSCSGDTGYSFGWINYDLIASKKTKAHMNPYGGEERIWLAPEGGQFSLFFKKGVPFDFEHWFTPAAFDTLAFDIGSKTDTDVLFRKDILLTNRAGTSFTMHIDRRISLLTNDALEKGLSAIIDSGVRSLAYKSENTITNTGGSSWTRNAGAPAVWLLGMLKPGPRATIILPIRKDPGDSSVLVHDTYFGAIPADRWKQTGDHAFLKADGKFRGKVGIPPGHTRKYIGSYDAGNKVLTILEALWPPGSTDFVNSAWEEQKDPFSGDAFNAYNDGPLKDGSQLGPFYELESLSPAAFLQPGKSITHTQITYHLQGDENALDKISRQVLGISLEDVERVFDNKKE
jgi:hypothetical protein